MLARYHVWSNSKHIGNTLDDLFGYAFTPVAVDLPKRLIDLYLRLPEGTLNTPDRIIQENTLFPLYKAFLTKERTSLIIQAMKESKKSFSIRTLVGGQYGHIKTPNFLRYCPLCLKVDKELYGEPYWHRIHQVPGVRVCPDHQVWLVESNVPYSVSQNNRALIALDSEQVKGFHEISASVEHYSHYLAISQSVHWLLKNEVPILGLQELTNRYKSILQLRGFANQNGRVKQRELAEAFLDFYGCNLLEENNSMIEPCAIKNWLRKIIWDCKQITHPLRHIIFIRFLGLTLENLFRNEEFGFYPFGQGPWRCLNPAASHFNQLVVEDCKISRYRGRTVGFFTCSCGFTYSRYETDLKGQDGLRLRRRKTYGSLWEKELLRLATEEKMSQRKISKRLNVSRKTVKIQLKKLLNMQSSQISRQVQPKIGRIEKYRVKLIDLIRSNPDKSRSELRSMAEAEYYYLSVNDCEWLERHLPKPKLRKQYRCRINWFRRDEELSEQVPFVVKRIKESPGKPQRISITSIGKFIGKLNMIRNLDKLPNTKKILDEFVESKEDFGIRCVLYAAQKLKRQGEKLTKSKIMREAGFWTNQVYSWRVLKAIEEEIDSQFDKKV